MCNNTETNWGGQDTENVAASNVSAVNATAATGVSALTGHPGDGAVDVRNVEGLKPGETAGVARTGALKRGLQHRINRYVSGGMNRGGSSVLKTPRLGAVVAAQGGGVAEAIASKLEVEGATVLVASHEVSAFSGFLQPNRVSPAVVHGLVVDFSREQDVERLFQRADGTLMHLDVFVYVMDASRGVEFFEGAGAPIEPIATVAPITAIGVVEGDGLGRKEAGGIPEPQSRGGRLEEDARLRESPIRVPIRLLEGAAERMRGRGHGVIIFVLVSEGAGVGPVGCEADRSQGPGRGEHAEAGGHPEKGRVQSRPWSRVLDAQRQILEENGIDLAVLEVEAEAVGGEFDREPEPTSGGGFWEARVSFAENIASAVRFCLAQESGACVKSMQLQVPYVLKRSRESWGG